MPPLAPTSKRQRGRLKERAHFGVANFGRRQREYKQASGAKKGCLGHWFTANWPLTLELVLECARLMGELGIQQRAICLRCATLGAANH